MFVIKMSFQEYFNKIKILDIISTNEISYLKDTDKRIIINKTGKFYYWRIYELTNSKIFNFLHNLEDDTLYTVIPIISKNDKSDEPFITLSQQILVSDQSNSLLIAKFLQDKIKETVNLYNINDLNAVLILKYKKVEIKFNES